MANRRIWRFAVVDVCAAAKHLAFGFESDVDFQADNRKQAHTITPYALARLFQGVINLHLVDDSKRKENRLNDAGKDSLQTVRKRNLEAHR